MRKISFFIVIMIITMPLTGQAGEIVLQPGPEDGIDVWIDSVYHGGGDDEGLRIGGWGDWYYSLIRFNMDSLPANVISAKIELYGKPDAFYNPSTMYLDRVTSYWDEDLMWIQNGPSYTNTETIPPAAPNQWYTIEITNLYNGWKDGTYENHGIQLRSTHNNHTYTGFYTSDYMDDPSLRPKLIVTIPSNCSLALDLSHVEDTFTMDFLVGTSVLATWNVWMSILNTTFPLGSMLVPIVDPPVSTSFSFPGVPSMGTIGVLTTLTTPENGILCSDWETVDTGPLSIAEDIPTQEKLKDLFKSYQ